MFGAIWPTKELVSSNVDISKSSVIATEKKIATLQMEFSIASSINICVLWLKFDGGLFPMVQFSKQTALPNIMSFRRLCQNHYLNNECIYRRVYATPILGETMFLFVNGPFLTRPLMLLPWEENTFWAILTNNCVSKVNYWTSKCKFVQQKHVFNKTNL